MALKGIRVLELAGLAPAPLCGAILADFGANVIRVDKHNQMMSMDAMSHGKKSIALNLKSAKGVEVFKRMSKQSDVIIEPFRKGVMEKLGLGPDVLLKDNKKLIYARLTGYGQKGPLALKAGHDINYAAISGVLSMLGRANQQPTPPVNILADFAGGGLTCAFGIVMALLERTRSGKGQVVDASMVEGAAYVSSWLFRSQWLPIWGKARGQNVLDSGAHFYDTYETKDGGFMAVGSLEPLFYEELLKGLGFTDEEAPQNGSEEETQKVRKLFSDKFASKTKAEWTEIFEKLDACVTPVLSIDEATKYSHNKERKTFVIDKYDLPVPNPAPVLSATPGISQAATKLRPEIGQHTREVMTEFGFSDSEITDIAQDGAAFVFEDDQLNSKL
ncbi:alpha-methylacyl-CoA racemase [Neocloeon triangulifer]|uniref:alpha-methylacyl-CoA racemase n=1 Tax=Neocloeon triangulifer TaxID=2078957 RepID=UPI00286F15C1|nr:alpha-methylacyl-CoA racemase [Neocloeon triangulifer]